MPRAPRLPYPGTFAHLTMHAVGDERLFLIEGEALAFVRILSEIVGVHDLEVHSYCLMPNHYHLLVRDVRARASEAMRDLNGRYSRWCNARRGRRGPLFSGRFHRTLVLDDSHLLTCVRYLALNPVEAGLCERASGWRWSSHRALAGLIGAPSYLRTDLVLGMLGSPHAYTSFVYETPPQRRRNSSSANPSVTWPPSSR
jgi:putative transposase